MSIGINVDGIIKDPVSIFAGINGEKKEIKEVYVNKDDMPILIYPSKIISIDNCYFYVANNCIIYSDNGVDWKELKTYGLPEILNAYTFAYGNGVYIFFSSGSQQYYRSTDLINWECFDPIFSVNTGTQGVSVKYFDYVGDIFICIYIYNGAKYSGGTYTYYNIENFYYSYDGITWNKISGFTGIRKKSSATNGITNSVYTYSDFYYSDGVYVCKAVEKYSSTSYYQVIYYSNDGITWKSSASYTSTTSSTLAHYGLNYIYCLNNIFIRKYYDSADSKTYVYYSYDGKSWTQSTLPTEISKTSSVNIYYFNNKFVIPISDSGNIVLYCSDDLNNWDSEYMDVIPTAGNFSFIEADDMLIAYTTTVLSVIKSYYYDNENNIWKEFNISEYTDYNPSISIIEYCNEIFFMKSISFPYILYSTSGFNFLPCNVICNNTININVNNDIFYNKGE